MRHYIQIVLGLTKFIIMKKYILLLVAVFIGIVSHAQEWEDKINSDPTYIKYKEETLNFYGSDDYRKEMNLKRVFNKKIEKSLKDYYKDFENYKDFEKWIDTNLNKTTFVDKEEAVELFNELRDLKLKNHEEVKKLKKAYNQLADQYGFEEFQEFEKKEVSSLAFERYFKNTLN